MQLTEEHKLIRESLRKLIDDEINPHVDEWEEAQTFPAHEVFKKLGDGGFLGISKPVEFGGSGLDHSYQVAMGEELGHIQLRRHPDGDRRADRHVHAGAGATRLGRAAPRVPGALDRRRPGRLHRRERGGRRAPTSRRSRPSRARTATTT